MSTPRIRRRLERGLYQDQYGLSAIVTVQGRTKEKRFAPGTPLRILRDWRKAQGQVISRSQPLPVKRGSLQADVDAYLAQTSHLVSAPELRSVLKAWTDRLGKRPRWSLVQKDVRDAIVAWTAAGVAPKTINNRMGALRRVYRVLDGRRAWCPCDEVELLPVPRKPVTYVTPEIIRATYAGLLRQEQAGKLRDSKTRARFMVLASSGVRASELMRAEPGDIDLERRVWLTRDGKGGFRPGGGVYLTSDLLAAWRVYIAASAWGQFNTGSMAKALRTAGWPRGVRPYQLRATVGLAMSESGVDLADISAGLGHSRPLTTRSHYVSVLGSRVQAAFQTIDSRIGFEDMAVERGTAQNAADRLDK
jgi:integrase